MMELQQAFIVWMQSHFHPALDPFFKAITFFGGFDGVFILWGFFVWCVSYVHGCRLIFVTELIHYIGTLWLKAFFALPRPFQSSPQIIGIVPERGFSFPSGHAINGISYWGYLAWRVRKPWVVVFSGVLILLIGFSRVYLGLHYPTDILGGWALGGAGVWLFVKTGPRWERYFKNRGVVFYLAWLFGSTLVLGLPFLSAPAGIVGRWAVGTLCIWFGTGIGWLANARWLKFEAGGSRRQKAGRLLVGYLVLVPVLTLFPKNPATFIFVSLWLTLGAPMLFRAVGLSSSKG